MEVYERLQQKLEDHPMGAPRRDSFLEILRILFTPAEVEVAVHIPFRPTPAERIAARAAVSLETVIALCEALADKGVVYGFESRGRRMYMLHPSAPGLFEIPFYGHRSLDLPFPRLGRLWDEYYREGWAEEFIGSGTHMGRVIPVMESVQSQTAVLPYEQVSHFIHSARSVSLGDCVCRVAFHRCDAPIDTCLAFNNGARFLAERGFGRLVSADEALDALRRAERAGLVHCASNSRDPVEFICACCSCCCVLMRTVTEIGAPAASLASGFVAAMDAQECTVCGACGDICPTRAITIRVLAEVDANRCIGCGLCVSACPTGALTLSRRAQMVEPPQDYAEWLTRVADEKGRLEAFRKQLE